MIIEKLDHHLRKALQKHSPHYQLPIILRYRRDKVMPKTLLPHMKVRHQFDLIPAVALTTTIEEMDRFSEDSKVERIWYDQTVRACLDASVPLIEAPRIWSAGYDGSGIKVGIVDTGVDPLHPDLSDQIGEMIDVTGEGSPDRSGHGTHVAGIVAGKGVASEGQYRGVAPGVQLFAAKVLRSDGSGVMSDTIAGLEWAIQQRVDVINLSLGAPPPGDGSDALSEACDAAVLKGFVICVAVGNDGPGEGTVGSPGCARHVITVGASTRQDSVAPFSSRGPTLDGRNKPDVLLPGEGIVACRAGNTYAGEALGEMYTRLSGSSMAAPHASGVAALLLQARPSLTPQGVKRALVDTALDLGLKASEQGAGRVQAHQAFVGGDASTAPDQDLDEREGCLLSSIAPLLRFFR
jgi:serine protease AprX